MTKRRSWDERRESAWRPALPPDRTDATNWRDLIVSLCPVCSPGALAPPEAVVVAVKAAPRMRLRSARGSNLCGRRFGPWKVDRLARAGGTTPLWLAHCVGCDHERFVNGCQLRNKPPRCGECGRAK